MAERLTGAGMRGVSIIESMVIDMNEAQVRTLEQVQQVVAGTQALELTLGNNRRRERPPDFTSGVVAGGARRRIEVQGPMPFLKQRPSQPSGFRPVARDGHRGLGRERASSSAHVHDYGHSEIPGLGRRASALRMVSSTRSRSLPTSCARKRSTR